MTNRPDLSTIGSILTDVQEQFIQLNSAKNQLNPLDLELLEATVQFMAANVSVLRRALIEASAKGEVSGMDVVQPLINQSSNEQEAPALQIAEEEISELEVENELNLEEEEEEEDEAGEFEEDELVVELLYDDDDDDEEDDYIYEGDEDDEEDDEDDEEDDEDDEEDDDDDDEDDDEDDEDDEDDDLILDIEESTVYLDESEEEMQIGHEMETQEGIAASRETVEEQVEEKSYLSFSEEDEKLFSEESEDELIEEVDEEVELYYDENELSIQDEDQIVEDLPLFTPRFEVPTGLDHRIQSESAPENYPAGADQSAGGNQSADANQSVGADQSKEVSNEGQSVVSQPASPVEDLFAGYGTTASQEARPMSVNELFGAQMQQRQPTSNSTGHSTAINRNDQAKIHDLKAAISLNDKLLFIKDLFNGYSLAYSEAIEILNRYDNMEEADEFLTSNYSVKNLWATKPETVQKLYSILQRRYS